MIKSVSSPSLSSLGNSQRGNLTPSMRISNSGAIEASRRSSVSCAALPMLPPQLLPSFDSELQIASAVHVSALSLASCEAEYHLPKLNQAPELTSQARPFVPNNPLSIDSKDDQLKQLAACLATPAEAAETEERNLESELRQSSRNQRSQSSLMMSGFQVMEDPLSTYQRFQASQRWEEWLRRLRRKRRNELFQDLFSKLGSKRFSWESSESF